MITQTTGDVQEVSILDLKGGAISERVMIETEKILGNIRDLNTPAKEKRVLTIKMEFVPNEERDFVATKTTISSRLSAYQPLETTLAVGGTPDKPAAAEWVRQAPGQLDFTGGEQESTKVIRMPHAL